MPSMDRLLENSYFEGDQEDGDNDGYALAWRYLGMFMDCDVSQDAYYNGACYRKILWAAYVDPEYSGASIGEYQFYDWEANRWDASTCQTERCARLDCHEPSTDFQLVGVFVETDGLEDWAEQLFKHEGYCLWGGDKEQEDNKDNDDVALQSDYQFMQNQRETWSQQECKELDWYDEEGNTLYYGVKPLPQGSMTFGIFRDQYCTIEDTTSKLEEYLMEYYLAKEKSEEEAQALIDSQMYTIERWNNRLNDYKVCQPCRAYNRVAMMGGNNRNRFLNDGEGENEQWGYNCYDDAGYTNCNQCYKFESQTDMTLATTQELERASKQGTITYVMVDGVRYGRGGIRKHLVFTEKSLYTLAAVLIVILGGFLWLARKLLAKRARRFVRELSQPPTMAELKEHLDPDDTVTGGSDMNSSTSSDDSVCFHQDGDEDSVVFHQTVDEYLDDMSTCSAKEKASGVLDVVETKVNRQQDCIDNLKLALDMEKVRRRLERDRLQAQVEALKAQLSKANDCNTGK